MANPKKPYKTEEFKAFIKTIQDPTVIAHWVEIAEALGVDPTTITEWKKCPEAIEARKAGIKEALYKMQYSGAKDWKMWESKLKMLGINPVDRTDLTSDGEKIQTVDVLELLKKVYGETRPISPDKLSKNS